MQTVKPFSAKTPLEIYLEYINDWLTIERMAENYGRSEEWLKAVIDEGKRQHSVITGDPIQTEQNIREMQALQNAADKVGLKVHGGHTHDRRKKQRYFCTLNGTSISPKLDYNDLNHFILGYIKAKQP